MARISFDGIIPNFFQTNREAWENWIKICVETYQYQIGRVAYHVVDNNIIQDLNKKILDHDYPTDIITLNNSTSSRLKVEMWLGFEVIQENSNFYGIEFQEEFARVVIHGLLHCMGFDDKDEQSQQEMRRQEDKCLISRPK